MKRMIGTLLRGRPRAQQFAMKLATYPRFLDWCEANQGLDTIAGGQREKRNALFDHVAGREGLLNRPVAYFEFGVHRGESIAWWYGRNADPASRFHGFDSFEGLPENWMKDRVEGFFSMDGQAPQVTDNRVRFHKGWFHHTLPGLLDLFDAPAQRVFHMDADLYRSTIFVLMQLGPMMRTGDIVMFDEFADSIHEFRAFEDFCRIFGAEGELIGATRGFVQTAFRLTFTGT